MDKETGEMIVRALEILAKEIRELSERIKPVEWSDKEYCCFIVDYPQIVLVYSDHDHNENYVVTDIKSLLKEIGRKVM